MGETGDDFRTFNEHKKAIRSKVEPKRFIYAKDKLTGLGSVIQENGDSLMITMNKGQIEFWPYSGWFCGRKPIGNIKGRGIENLIEQLKGLYATNKLP